MENYGEVEVFKISEELSYLQSSVTYIKVVDDSFVDGYRDEEWCKTFADEIIKRGIRVRLRGQIRADITDNIFGISKTSWIYSFACGIEMDLKQLKKNE